MELFVTIWYMRWSATERTKLNMQPHTLEAAAVDKSQMNSKRIKWSCVKSKLAVLYTGWRDIGRGGLMIYWEEEEHHSKKSQQILAKLTWLYLLYFFWDCQWMFYVLFTQGANIFIVKIIINIIMSKWKKSIKFPWIKEALHTYAERWRS